MSTPFDNPWYNNGGGPRYGNAYEADDSDYNHNAYTSPKPTHMPMPSNYANTSWSSVPNQANSMPYTGVNASPYVVHSPPYGPVPSQLPQTDAYQYTGTPYAVPRPMSPGIVYPGTPIAFTDGTQGIAPAKMNQMSNPDFNNNNNVPRRSPNKRRVILRLIMFLASVGHLGFAAGASPYSGDDVPFYTPACFYYLFAVASLSILYSGYHLLLFCYRFISKKPNMNRSVMLILDVILAFMWGLGVIIEVVKFRCTAGGGFCAFYNVSIFWGFLAFALYIVAIIWDIFGSCGGRNRSTK